MDVIEVKNPRTLALLPVQQLLKRGIDTGALLAPGGWDSTAADLFRYITEDSSFFLLGAEKGKFKSFVLGHYPVGNLFPYPTVLLFYNEGSKALLKATQKKLLDTLVENGYTQMLAVNHTGRRNDVYLKVMTPEGATSRVIGSLAMFEVE